MPMTDLELTDKMESRRHELELILLQGGLLKYLKTLESRYIFDALLVADFNASKAARLLGMNRTNLAEKRKKYGYPMKKPSRQKEM